MSDINGGATLACHQPGRRCIFAKSLKQFEHICFIGASLQFIVMVSGIPVCLCSTRVLDYWIYPLLDVLHMYAV